MSCLCSEYCCFHSTVPGWAEACCFNSWCQFVLMLHSVNVLKDNSRIHLVAAVLDAFLFLSIHFNPWPFLSQPWEIFLELDCFFNVSVVSVKVDCKLHMPPKQFYFHSSSPNLHTNKCFRMSLAFFTVHIKSKNNQSNMCHCSKHKGDRNSVSASVIFAGSCLG